MKKILATLLAGIVLLQTGCSLIFPGADESSKNESSRSPLTDYSSEYENRWCYQRLDPRLQSGYGEVYAAVRDSFGRDATVTISDSTLGTQSEYNGLRVELTQALQSRDEAKLLYTAFLWDNPQFFYIGNTYSYEGHRSGETDFYNVFCLVYTMSAQERAVAARQFDNAISSLMGEMRHAAPTGQYETELLLHDALASVCTYESRASKTDDPASLYPTAFTAYGALVEGRAVCEGYSRAMQVLLHEAGMECTLVSGTDQNGVAHMWNLVTVDGRNYHLDPTWNDNSDRLHHSYFNLTTAEILLSHTLDADNIGVDTCTALDANYYRRSGHYLDTVRRDDIAAMIAQAVKQGKTMIDLRFTRTTFASARLFINNRALLTQKVNALLAGTGLTMWNYEEYNVNETYYTLTLYQQETTGTTT